MPQRILLGACSLFALFWPELKTRGHFISFCLLAAWALQTISAVEFGRKSNVYANSLRSAYALVPPSSTIMALTDARPWAYRANPILHADALAVLAGPEITSLNLYEAAYGYFPLQFQKFTPGLEPRRLERISLMRSPAEAGARAVEISEVLRLGKAQANRLIVLASVNSSLRNEAARLLKQESGWSLIKSSNEIEIYRRE